MFYEWKDGDDDPNLNPNLTLSNKNAVDSTIELDSLKPSNDTDLTSAANDKSQVPGKKPGKMSVRFARLTRGRGDQRRGLEHQAVTVDDSTEVPAYTNVLRTIKVVSLLVIGACALVGMIFSKITFVSITGRMYSLYTASQDPGNNQKSVIFFQLVFILVIPEILSLAHCVVLGFIGKTSRTFPWPSWKAMALGLVSSVVEVIAVCGFVFGVACKLPPPLTILLLSGVFWVVIARHFFWDIVYKRIIRRSEYDDIDESDTGVCVLFLKRKLVPFLEFIALLMQVGALIAIPIILGLSENDYDNADKFTTLYILIPVTLTVISVVWSGWIQKYLVEPRTRTTTVNDEMCYARLKSGMINSFVKIVIIPFVAYGYAVLLLDFQVTFTAENFRWTGLELSTFLTHVIVSFVAYLFLWMASALQSWAFFIPMLLSTPISFVWYVGSAESNEFFPFIDLYFVNWNLKFVVFVVASLLWISQILAFGYYVFQSSDRVLTSDSNLFWTPRYNGAFLEQHILLNRKTEITGHYEKQQAAYDPYKIKNIAKDSHIFICSTMYHENEIEMKQMLRSINRVAMVSGSESEDHHKYESHVFFDNALSGEHLNQWVMQLLGLLKETLGVEPANVTKLFTPYGMQLKYKLKGNMPFYVHLKDNTKVRNKKRWSQVMYMSYVLGYRIKHSQIPKDKAFILTTDADIDFTSDDVVALLDFLARDDGVGAVCARTHPLGSGPVVWYQIFDYAVGHWFQKAAEHILGCVLCCPGCFSAFRVSAVEQVLSTYSSGVENGFDFLTKDMGEDRWLCTLLIQAGWRLEYAAVSQDSTYCPETFEEFFKQRRRWIPSTVANLALVISSYGKITASNDSISIMFILYQFLLVFSTLISPATVILIIVTGLVALDENIDEVALIVVLCVMSVLYGVVCVYATEKTQLDVAKVLTLIFAIIMAVVVSGILTDTISSVIEGDPLDDSDRNGTADTFRFPVDVTSVYLGIFAGTFILAGILHLNEISCLFHFIWYILCLPSGYLFLTIYSACNINNRSWGTREGASPKSSGKSDSWLDYFLGKWHIVLGFFWKCIGWKPRSKVDETPPPPPDKKEHIVSDLIPEPKLSQEVEEWLIEIECEMYAANFEREGYTELDFIATMKMGDIIAIGVNKRGFQLKLEKEIKKLNTPEVSSEVPDNVLEWLQKIKLHQYRPLFKSEGYCTDEDVENLKGLKRKDLESIGITRRAHLNQLLTRLRYLQYPTDIEIQTNRTRKQVEQAYSLHLSEVAKEDLDSEVEYKFWHDLAENVLKPESANLGKVEELKEKLLNLRNLALLVLLLTNIMWIVFLYTLIFPQLTQYNLPDRAFSLFFLGVFSIIILIQAIAMIFHRFVTLVHLLARTKIKNRRLEANWFQPSGIDTISRAHY